MANTLLFPRLAGRSPPAANAHDEEGVPAFALDERHQLAQLAATGCLNQTFYAQAEPHLDAVLALAQKVDASFVAKAAIHAREAGYMNMSALLTAVLAVRDVALCAQVFGRTIDDGKMLRNFVQIVRSGAAGRKSLGSRPKKLVQHWLLNATETQLLNAAVGSAPTLADVVKMVHPKPAQAWRTAWFAWLIGKPFNEAALPPITLAFEQFKRAVAAGQAPDAQALPEVPFQMLTALELSTAQWAQIARTGSWQMVRQNLNTFARQGVFEVKGMAEQIAAKLRDRQAIAQAHVLPYQLMVACQAGGDAVPAVVREALQDAMETALANVPDFAGRVAVCPDVSGSMHSPVTGFRRSATSTVRCIDVAALVAAAVLRKNPSARVLPFEQQVVTKLRLNPRDSVIANAQALAAIGGAGTNCGAPLALLNAERAAVDLVILVSDNESWVDATRHGATQTMHAWETLKNRNPRARLVCIDIQPYGTTQAAQRQDILNVGGFSDAVFATVAAFAQGKTSAGHWAAEIEKIPLAVQ